MAEPRSRRTAITVALLLTLQALAVLGYLFVERRREFEQAEPLRYESLVSGRSLPDASLATATGRTLTTRGFAGRPVLLHFWATWCPPCREELPALLALRDRRDLVIVAVALDDDWPAVERFFGGRVPPEVVRDPARALIGHYEVGALPDTYLLDPRGVAIARFGGPRRWGSDTAVEALDALVRSAGAPESE